MHPQPPEQDAGTLGLRQYLETIRRRKWIVVVAAVAAVVAAVAVSLLQDPVYRATTKIVIGQGNSLFQPQFGNAFQPFTATARELVKSNVVAAQVVEQLGLDRTPESLLEDVSVSIDPETAVLNVEVQSTDGDEAQRIAQSLAETFSTLFNDRFGETDGAESQALTATVWDPARIDPRRVSPRPARNVAVALVLGLVLGLMTAFLRDHFDRGLRSRDDVEAAFGLPVIGQIPFRKLRRDERVLYGGAFPPGAEAFRALRANLQYLGVKRPLRTILVTSAGPEQGKTTVASNLAVAIAQGGSSVVVVEGDLRRPRLAQSFGVTSPPGVGITGVLVGAADVEEALVPLSVEGLEPGQVVLLSSGPLPPNPTELLSSVQMTTVLDRLAGSFDYVLVDSPPLLPVADSLELARVADGVVLVVRSNRATIDEAREVRALVERLGINLAGAVLTDTVAPGAYGGYGETSEPRQPVAAEAVDRI